MAERKIQFTTNKGVFVAQMFVGLGITTVDEGLQW